MLTEVLERIAQIGEDVPAEKKLAFLDELNNVGIFLQYIAHGNTYGEDFNFEKPVPVNLIPAPIQQGPKQLCVNPITKQYFLRVHVPDDTPHMSFWTCWRKVAICGNILRRPHSICTHCLFVKRQRNQIPEYIPVQPIIWNFRLDVPFGKFRLRVIKLLQEIIEFVSDF